jgi:hypothetical protein
MLKRVYYPLYIQKGILKNHKGCAPGWKCGSFDTETCRGHPHTIQFCFDGKVATLDYVRDSTILDVFMSYLDKWAEFGKVNALFAHHLSFDLQCILYAHIKLFGGIQRDFTVKHSLGKIHAFCDKTWFARVYLSGGRRVLIIDSFAFFTASLERTAELVKAPFLKLERPADLGKRRLKDPGFERYAIQDALATWYVGMSIIDLHHEYDAQPCVSAPHMASRIFRHKFLREEDCIAFPPPHICRASELSYHGGKNQMRVDLKPGWYDGVYELDINSAYGWAMTTIPSFLGGEYREVNEVPWGEHGVVLISGRQKFCPYGGGIFTHDFKKIPAGEVRDLWVTTYELESAIRNNTFEPSRVHGFVWRSTHKRNPLAEYVKFFWELKNERLHTMGKGTLGYNTAKLLMLSCYGKFIQTVLSGEEMVALPDGSVELDDTWTAGGLYNPMLATLITGKVRQRIYDFECKYNSMHTSTDAVKTTMTPDPADITDKMGDLSVEIYGRCLLLRPKLYVHESAEVPGKVKGAFHGFMAGKEGGFKGRLKALLDASGYITKGKKFEYLYLHCFSGREAMKRTTRKEVPLNFRMVKRCLQPVATG